MSEINKTRFLAQHESCECKCGLNESEVYVIESKNGIKMKVGVFVKNQMIGLLGKMIISGFLVHLIASVIRHLKLTNIQILKIVHVKNVYFVLEFEDEIVNTAETSLMIKK